MTASTGTTTVPPRTVVASPRVPRATAVDTLRIAGRVLLPLVERGVIIRRRKVVWLGERLDADRTAVERVRELRERYGRGPVRLRIPFRSMALVLHPDDVHRVLEETPEPFATATTEKRAALGHFQPKGVLISSGPAREARRRGNEHVLRDDLPVHHGAERFVRVVHEEASRLAATVDPGGVLRWEQFGPAWFRVVRRVVLGDAARDDHDLTEELAALRHRANWAYLAPRRRDVMASFLGRLSRYVAAAEPGSLAALLADVDGLDHDERVQQIPQWLFAFDPAGMTTFRTLAVLATHPDAERAAREEVDAAARAGGVVHAYDHLRRCMLETLRLWPTTPAILRQTTAPTTWPTGSLPSGTSLLVFAPFFHRDDTRVDAAHRFDPDRWVGGRDREDWPLVPFSGGPAMCTGRNIVLLTGSTMLAALLPGRTFCLDTGALGRPRLDPARPLPSVLDLYSLRLHVAPRPPSGTAGG